MIAPERIWKFELKVVDEQKIEIPLPAKILSVQANCGKPCIWAVVDPDANWTTRTIYIHRTGQHLEDPNDKIFLGTFQLDDGQFVGHVFLKSREF